MPSAFDFIRLPVPCPQCGQDHPQRLTELVASDNIACLSCGAPIDISSKEWRSFIDEAADLYKTIRRV